MIAHSNSVGLFGLEAFMVQVEADFSKGMPVFSMVGLPDIAVKESRDRVHSAMINCGFSYPSGRIVLNLAPADRKKEGPVYDLPILIALLMASGQINANLEDSVFVGELSLSGDVRPVSGVLSMTIKAQESGYKHIFVPKNNANEAGVVKGIAVHPVDNIKQLFNHLIGKELIPPVKYIYSKTDRKCTDVDFSQVRGQFEVKRALEIAAAGGHNILLLGSPGSGKSMLAKRMSTIMPDMTFEETIETTKIHSVAGHLRSGGSLITERPFRSPHHTVSPAGLSGGGSMPKPGEISLAHNGILFLDELPEFPRATMEVLRQPIEDGFVTISRVNGTLTYPCRVMLIAAMNPCPCGYYGHPTRKCTCSHKTVQKYLSKVSGPLLDRIDIHVEVQPVEFADLASDFSSEPSSEIKKRVDKARAVQTERYKNTEVTCNARLNSDLMRKVCIMDEKASALLKKAFEKMGLSARAYDKILKVSRTIADMDSSDVIKANHILEAVQYRNLDRKYWTNEN